MRYGKASINEYFGIKGSPKNTNTNNGVGDYQIIPQLAYYDIFKNYYANKQEERFYVMGGSTIQNSTTIESEDFTGYISDSVRDTLVCTKESTVAIKGTDLKIEDIKKVLYTIDTNEIYVSVVDKYGNNPWKVVPITKNEIIIKTVIGNYYRLSKKIQ